MVAEKVASDPMVDEEAPSKHIGAGDVDEALKFLDNVGSSTLVEIDEKKLVRKIDLRIVPLMLACYLLEYLDKTLLNYANVMGLKEDTGISGNQYSTLATIFYVTFLAAEFPTGYLMQRLPTAKYLGVNVCLWGAMVAATAGAKNWATLVALRVLLGCFEAVIAPALVLITSMWYRREEQPLRVGCWYLGTGGAQIIGALASYGFQFYGGQTFKSWQIMFLVFGLITVAVGGLVIWVLPDNPMSAKFLTHDEKVFAIERLRDNKTGIENKHFKPYQVWECFKDPQMYLICALKILSAIPNGAVSSYQAAIIKSFGYTSKQTSLLSIGSGAVAITSIISVAWFGGRFNASGPAIIFLLAFGGVLGGGLVAFSPREAKAAQLTGNFLTNIIGSSMTLLLAYAATNFAGYTKKITMNAMLLIAFCIGNIVGPLTFREKDAPQYTPAKIAIVATTASAILVTLMLMGYYYWQNKRRDRLMAGQEHQENSEFFDLTDRENLEFRYRY